MLDVAAELVALVQHRHVTVRDASAFVEIAAGQFTEAIEMRLDVAEQRIGQMQFEQIGQRRIGPIKIHSRGVGGEQARLAGRGGLTIMRAWLH
jgi:hypothetical protein